MIAVWDFLRALDPRIYWIAVIASSVHFLIRVALNIPGGRITIAGIFVGNRSALNLYRRLVDAFVTFTKGLLYSKEGEKRSFLEGYAFFIAIAWSYTVLFFLLGWATGGSGSVGQFRIIAPDYAHNAYRVAIVLGFAASGYFVWRSSKLRQAQQSIGAISPKRRLVFAAIGSLVFRH